MFPPSTVVPVASTPTENLLTYALSFLLRQWFSKYLHLKPRPQYLSPPLELSRPTLFRPVEGEEDTLLLRVLDYLLLIEVVLPLVLRFILKPHTK